MGSFDVACGMSALTINEGDRAGLQLLAPQKYRSWDEGAVSTSSMKNFMPLCLPVYGSYNSYGDLDDLEPGPGVTMIEKLFNRPAADVLPAITEGRGLYDSCGHASKLYLTPGHKLGEYEASLFDQLESLGFKRMDDQEESEFVFGRGSVIADRRHINEIRKDSVPAPTGVGNGYGLDSQLRSFSAYTGEYPGVAPEDIPAVRLFTETGGMFFLPQVEEALTAHLSNDFFHKQWRKSFDEGWKVMEAQFAASTHGEMIRHPELGFLGSAAGFRNVVVESLRDVIAHPEIYDLLEGLTADEAYWFLRIRQTMDSANRFFGPSMYVSEGNGHDNDVAMQGITNKILRERTKRRNEDR